MKIHFIGGRASAGETAKAAPFDESGILQNLGREVAAARHEAVLSSPFEGSVDMEILRGVAASNKDSPVELHYPNTQEIRSAWQSLLDQLGLRKVRTFAHAPLERHVAMGDRYAWLLAQLEAMETAQLVIAAGGKVDGSASMLLHFAEAKARPILPLGYLGGAAAASLERQRYRLRDQLGELADCLHEPKSISLVMQAAARLAAGGLGHGQSGNSYFISYSRENSSDADLVEMTLRRRGLEVFRDERAFRPGADLKAEISENIHKATVIIALWSKGYACSPWCYDEFELAIRRKAAGGAQLWILLLDDTRVVPPAARNMLAHRCDGRFELESRLIALLDQPAEAGASKT